MSWRFILCGRIYYPILFYLLQMGYTRTKMSKLLTSIQYLRLFDPYDDKYFNTVKLRVNKINPS